MKACVYVAVRGERRQAYLSIAPEADEMYWSNAVFCEGVLAGWGMESGRSSEKESGAGLAQLIWLPEPLPLGIAVSVRERLAAKVVTGGRKSNLHSEIQAAVRWAREQIGATIDMGNERCEVEYGYAAAGPGQGFPSWLRGRDIRDIGYRMGRLARQLSDRLRGRQLLEAEAESLVSETEDIPLHVLLQIASLLGGVRLVSGVAPINEADKLEREKTGKRGWGRRNRKTGLRCRRCGSGETRGNGQGERSDGIRRTPCASCGRMRCAYCESCLTMGRSRECGLLVLGEPNDLQLTFPYRAAGHYLNNWGLSEPQREAAEAAVWYLLNRGQPAQGQGANDLSSFGRMLRGRKSSYERTFLLWAVTGAGKTEMIFPLLQAVLSAGGRAAIAAPRRDVVLELAPRLAKAFPEVSLAVLYGGSPDRFAAGNLTLATTHQLIRFKEAFDLVVIDEVDAFPYHNDPTLQFAGANACASKGVTVLLSATPPVPMQRAVRRRRLPCARVSVRYHRHPLPVPKRLNISPISRWANGNFLPAKLAAAIRHSIVRGAQVFLFVPYIRQTEPLVRCLRKHAGKLGLAPEAIDGTSSLDPDRGDKVMAFRARDIRLLVTTTILERGVTIPMSDVFVLDADKPLFDAASLVQMAGRAGRSSDDPNGLVYFAAPAWTASQREARRQIREMNAYARKKGYLAI